MSSQSLQLSLPSFSATIVCLLYFPFKNLQDPNNLCISSITQVNTAAIQLEKQETEPCELQWAMIVLGMQFKGVAQHNPGTRTGSNCYTRYESHPYFLGYLKKVLSFLLWHHSHASSVFTEQKHCPVLCKSWEGKLDLKHVAKGTTVKWSSLQWPNSRKLCQVIIFLTLSVSFPEVHKCSKQF